MSGGSATRACLAQTIRPRIWRGYAGSIYTMALPGRRPRSGGSWRSPASALIRNRAEINLFRFPGLQQGRPATTSQPPFGTSTRSRHERQCAWPSIRTGQFLASGSNDATMSRSVGGCKPEPRPRC